MSVFAMEKDKRYNQITQRVQTPDGTLFVTIIEGDNGEPIMIAINGAKTGTSVAAWCNALVNTMNICLTQGIDYSKFIEEFSNITTSKAIRLVNGVTFRSGPEGIAVALMRYRDEKVKEQLEDELDDSDDESDDIRPRWIKR